MFSSGRHDPNLPDGSSPVLFACHRPKNIQFTRETETVTEPSHGGCGMHPVDCQMAGMARAACRARLTLRRIYGRYQHESDVFGVDAGGETPPYICKHTMRWCSQVRSGMPINISIPLDPLIFSTKNNGIPKHLWKNSKTNVVVQHQALPSPLSAAREKSRTPQNK